MIINGFPGGAPITPYGEIDLNQFTRTVSASDANLNAVEILFKRSDTTLFMKRSYTNPISVTLNQGLYQTCTEYFYAADGVSIRETHVYTFTFTAIGNLGSYSRVVS